jgi:hypothetical protein
MESTQDQPGTYVDDLDVAASVPCVDSSCTYEGIIIDLQDLSIFNDPVSS